MVISRLLIEWNIKAKRLFSFTLLLNKIKMIQNKTWKGESLVLLFLFHYCLLPLNYREKLFQGSISISSYMLTLLFFLGFFFVIVELCNSLRKTTTQVSAWFTGALHPQNSFTSGMKRKTTKIEKRTRKQQNHNKLVKLPLFLWVIPSSQGCNVQQSHSKTASFCLLVMTVERHTNLRYYRGIPMNLSSQ